MPMCKGCKEVVSASEIKDGLYSSCIKNGVPQKVEEIVTVKKNANPYGKFGIALVVIGLIWGIWAFTMDTTVTTEGKIVGSGKYAVYVAPVTVNNIGLMNKQRNYLMGAGVSIIVGVLVLLMGVRREEVRS